MGGGRGLPFFTRGWVGGNFCDFLFALLHTNFLLKGGLRFKKKKECAPLGSNFFPFKVDPFFRRETKQC